MTIFVAHDDASYTEDINRRGATQRQFDYFGKSSTQQFGPEAFLVDYGPERTTTAHFHSVDQFQVFFGAPGARYQRHPIPAVELHYADAFVTYGPFSAGEARMRFFTLRPCQGQYKGEMPSERSKLRYRGRRSLHVDLAPYFAVSSAGGEPVVAPVIAPHDDGLSATFLTAGPGVEIVLPSTAATSGGFACVLSGEVEVRGHVGQRLGKYSLGWAGPGEVPIMRTTHAPITRVLSMTYPYPPTPEAHEMARRHVDEPSG
jgi:hypothetical protein